MKKKKAPAETIIGWREYVCFPDWGISSIRAKADTGARSNALDVSHLEEVSENRVRFEVVPDRRDRTKTVSVEAEITRRTRVRSSFGQSHDRVFVKTRILVADLSVDAEFGLVDRKNMLCRVLLGRKTLHPSFLVDSGHCYLHGKRKRKRALKKP